MKMNDKDQLTLYCWWIESRDRYEAFFCCQEYSCRKYNEPSASSEVFVPSVEQLPSSLSSSLVLAGSLCAQPQMGPWKGAGYYLSNR